MIEASSLYHNSTSYDRHKMTPHFLDWQNQPMVFKDYPGIKPVSLPRNDKLPEESFISLLRPGRTFHWLGALLPGAILHGK